MTKFIILNLIVILSCIIDVKAETISTTDSPHTEYLTHSHNSNQHKIPSAIFLECHYSVGHIGFSMPSNTEYLYIIIGDEATPVWTGFVTRTTPETDIPVLSGEYAITCRTDGNQIFSGMLKF